MWRSKRDALSARDLGCAEDKVTLDDFADEGRFIDHCAGGGGATETGSGDEEQRPEPD